MASAEHPLAQFFYVYGKKSMFAVKGNYKLENLTSTLFVLLKVPKSSFS